ncbi:MAG: hypothetical protein R2852_03205 [Bacteroidia bacterium]
MRALWHFQIRLIGMMKMMMSDVIHEWHKDDKDMEINKANMEVWKQKLQAVSKV